MRSQYVPQSEKLWIQYFADQANQSGAGFVGLPYQRGAGLGSVFRSIFRALLPLAKSASKSIGRQALTTGAEIASDIVAGNSIKAAAKKRGRTAAASLLTKAAQKLQSGEGLGKRPAASKRPRVVGKVKETKKSKKKKLNDQLGVYYR